MADDIEPKNQCCVGCLCMSKDNNLLPYKLQNESLKTMFQTDHLSLCYICKRMVQHTENFIQSVQSNQILLENFHNVMDLTLQSFRLQTQAVILTQSPIIVVELNENETENIDEPFKVIHNSTKTLKIKEEMKEEDEEVNHLDEVFDDNDFQEELIKEEDECPLNDVFKKGSDIEIDLKQSKRMKKGKVKKKQVNDKAKVLRREGKVTLNIEKIFITKEQCMEERERMLQDTKYLDCTYKCVDCIKGFVIKNTYKKHLELHSESQGTFVCDICKQRTSSEEKMLSHERYHQERYKCGECNLIRISRQTIKDHILSKHCTGYFHYNCPHCSKHYNRKGSLAKHISYAHTQRSRVTCAYCHKTYANKNALRTHLITRHAKEEPSANMGKKHVCQECGKAFKAPSLLRNHSIKHTRKREYYCVECDKSFKSSSHLSRHLKTTSPHINYIELPLACQHCEKRFSIRRDLERHMNRVHLNIKPFKCDTCDKAYVNNWSLKEHQRLIHEGYKRPMKFPCPMCDKIFDRNQILKAHIRTHTGERPYLCTDCPAQFTQAGILRTHIKLIHLKQTRDGRPKAVAMK